MAPSNAARVSRHLPAAMWCLASLGALPSTSPAARVDYEIGVALRHSDNITLIKDDPIHDTVLSPQLRFQADQTGSTVQMLLHGDLEYAHYLGGTFSDEIVGQLDGRLNWTVLPERMDMVFENNLTRQSISLLGGFAPDNQQQVNVFNAGPSFYARLGKATRGQLDLRYGNSYAEETSTFNGDRYNAAARVLRDLSTTTAVTANAEATRVEFDTIAAASDYTRYDGYVGYSRKLSEIDIGLALGYSWLNIRDAVGRSTAPLVRAELAWRLSPRSRINANLAYQISDAAQDVIVRGGSLDGRILRHSSNSDVLVGPSVFRQRQIETGYEFNGERLTVQLQPYYQRIRYLDGSEQNHDNRGGVFVLDYRLQPQLTSSFFAARADRNYVGLAREDQDTTLGVYLVNQVTRHWSWRIDLQHRSRDSSAINQGYDENALIFTVSYRR